MSNNILRQSQELSRDVGELYERLPRAVTDLRMAADLTLAVTSALDQDLFGTKATISRDNVALDYQAGSNYDLYREPDGQWYLDAHIKEFVPTKDSTPLDKAHYSANPYERIINYIPRHLTADCGYFSVETPVALCLPSDAPFTKTYASHTRDFQFSHTTAYDITTGEVLAIRGPESAVNIATLPLESQARRLATLVRTIGAATNMLCPGLRSNY